MPISKESRNMDSFVRLTHCGKTCRTNRCSAMRSIWPCHFHLQSRVRAVALIERTGSSSAMLFPVIWKIILAQGPLSFFNTVLVSFQDLRLNSRVGTMEEPKRRIRRVNGIFLSVFCRLRFWKIARAMDIQWLTGTVGSLSLDWSTTRYLK